MGHGVRLNSVSPIFCDLSSLCGCAWRGKSQDRHWHLAGEPEIKAVSIKNQFTVADPQAAAEREIEHHNARGRDDAAQRDGNGCGKSNPTATHFPGRHDDWRLMISARPDHALILPISVQSRVGPAERKRRRPWMEVSQA